MLHQRKRLIFAWLLALCLLAGALPCALAAAQEAVLGESPNKEDITEACEVLLITDADTGEILLEKDADLPYTISGQPVLWMTALTALQYLDLSDTVENSVRGFGLPDGVPTLGIRRGDEFTVRDLIAAMTLYGARDAAVVLRNQAMEAAYAAGAIQRSQPASPAEDDGDPGASGTDELDYKQFSLLMNAKAAALGMTQTHYVSALGLEDNAQVSCAADQRLMIRAIMEDKALFRILRMEQYTMEIANARTTNTFRTTVPLMDARNASYDQRVRAAATGSNAAGVQCDTYAQTDNRNILIVLWCSNATEAEGAILIRQVMDHYGAITTVDMLTEAQRKARSLSVKMEDAAVSNWKVDADELTFAAYQGFKPNDALLELRPDMGTVYVTPEGDTEIMADILYDGLMLGSVQLTTNRGTGSTATQIASSTFYTAADVKAKPQTLFQAYGWAICIGGAALLGLAVILVGKIIRDRLDY